MEWIPDLMFPYDLIAGLSIGTAISLPFALVFRVPQRRNK